MREENGILERIQAIRQTLIESGYFDPSQLPHKEDKGLGPAPRASALASALQAAREVRSQLSTISAFLHDKVVDEVLRLDKEIRDPHHYEELGRLLRQLLDAGAGFSNEKEFVAVYGELLSSYILCLYRCGSPGRESPIIRMILTSIARRKAIEMGHSAVIDSFATLKSAVTVALITKRHALYVLATRGMTCLFRVVIDYAEHGNSPQALALQVANLMVKNGVRLADVTDLVCGGGDLGTLPDGIYVLSRKVHEESWKRLENSALNRGALVTCELRELLNRQVDGRTIHASLCNPLSFSTLGSHDLGSFLKEESRELSKSLKGFVKVTPLKSFSALLSEILGINQDHLNLLVMALDGLFASVVRKIGPRIVREMAAQDANGLLSDFDFKAIVERLGKEGFEIPKDFALASLESGTGVREICELLRILESDKISDSLKKDLSHVPDSYARHVAMALEMASIGRRSERPHFIAIGSMMALDPFFQKLFAMIRNRLDSPFTPLMCLDSLEHEYLIANHLFERYVNVAGDRRLHYSLEARSIARALKVLGSSHRTTRVFSFDALFTRVRDDISNGTLSRANIVLVGSDNEDALEAVSLAREQGLLDRIVLIGNPEDTREALERTRVPLSPGEDSQVEMLPIDPLAVDMEDKKRAMAQTFRTFLEQNSHFVVMKGSVDTAGLLRQALSIYHSEDPSGASGQSEVKRMASNTAIFELPDGRFFALSDAAVNPSFSKADDLLKAIENQLDVVRTVVDSQHVLKVAIVTAVEKETKAIPATLLAAETERKALVLEQKYGPLVVEGPLSFDIATVPEVAEEKHYQGRIMGDANCLMTTEINTANVIYKMLSKTMGSLGLMIENGAIITAGPGTTPIVLTSRGDTAGTKFNSILLAMAYSSADTVVSSRSSVELKQAG